MTYADLHRTSADDDASTVAYHRNLGLEPPPAPARRVSLADQFGEVDAALRRLKVRREELRQQILDMGRVELVGHTWAVVLEDRTSRRLDQDMLIERFGAEAVDACRAERNGVYLRTDRL
ncbi:hypothetical protein [Bradyrhizobium sp. CB2312]|uniref:hypothetical protein n=1 Tax=Bradyrhizobium sp. CB2312 TaxID=3039155 RepID=UPI0024B1B4F7|nr:hypothetical protein [Bradyrhizobium sp. CB2312]WFU76600.1 hypothetical protein QA642_22630 [Bradyrhizobium sp. CB2312]